ncbi:MAG: hypothetical protein RSB23_06930 [Alistipes sp.]
MFVIFKAYPFTANSDIGVGGWQQDGMKNVVMLANSHTGARSKLRGWGVCGLF